MISVSLNHLGFIFENDQQPYFIVLPYNATVNTSSFWIEDCIEEPGDWCFSPIAPI